MNSIGKVNCGQNCWATRLQLGMSLLLPASSHFSCDFNIAHATLCEVRKERLNKDMFSCFGADPDLMLVHGNNQASAEWLAV